MLLNVCNWHNQIQIYAQLCYFDSTFPTQIRIMRHSVIYYTVGIDYKNVHEDFVIFSAQDPVDIRHIEKRVHLILRGKIVCLQIIVGRSHLLCIEEKAMVS